MLYSGESYMEQVKQVLKNIGDGITKKDFELLYKAAEDKNIKEDKRDLVDRIVKAMFRSLYSNEVLIPWNFFETPIGEVVAIVRFHDVLKVESVVKVDMDNIINANELSEICDFNLSYVYKLIKQKKLDADYVEKTKTYLITEENANKYLANSSKYKNKTIKQLKNEIQDGVRESRTQRLKREGQEGVKELNDL